MAQEIVQPVNCKFTPKARRYIKEELGYRFEGIDQYSVIHALTWLKVRGHPIELQLDEKSLTRDGPIEYIVDMSKSKGGKGDAHYFFPNQK